MFELVFTDNPVSVGQRQLLPAGKQLTKGSLHSLLLQEIEEVFGRRILNMRDCIHLSDEIYFRTSSLLNPNTLRRFFGLVKAEYPPSLHTLTIMSKYCGYSSLEEVHTTGKRKEARSREANDLFVEYLVSLFKESWVSSNNETYLALVKHTIQYIIKYPEVAEPFQKQVAKTKNGRRFYFEKFVNVDNLNKYYGDGLEYYLNEAKNKEELIFGYATLCFKFWLCCDKELMQKNFEEIKRLKLTREMSTSVKARFFTAQLLYAEMYGLDFENILLEAYHEHAQIIHGKDEEGDSGVFEYILAGTLLMVGQYNESLYYAAYALKKLSSTKRFNDKGLGKTVNLYIALTQFHLGNKKEAIEIFEKLRPSQFNLLTRQINTILFLKLSLLLNNKNQPVSDQLDELIRATGFERLKAFPL